MTVDVSTKINTIKVMVNGNVLGNWNGKIENCKACGNQIGFAKMPSGKITPFNFDKQKTSHFSNCKNVNDFRNSK